MLFCPSCANMLTVSKKGTHHFICNTCPYQYPISHSMVGRTHMKRKEVDDVLGGEAAWANVDATDGKILYQIFIYKFLTVFFSSLSQV